MIELSLTMFDDIINEGYYNVIHYKTFKERVFPSYWYMNHNKDEYLLFNCLQ